jgi:hypothetical protein
LILLIIIHSLAALYKIIVRPYQKLVENIFTFLGDLSFIIALGFKLNDYLNWQNVRDTYVEDYQRWND